MRENERLARRYCQEVRKKLPVGGRQKRIYLETMYQRVVEFLETSEQPDEAAVEARFGDPETIALAFIGEMSYQEISRKFRFRNRVIAISLAVAILATAGIAIAFRQIIKYNKNEHNGYIVQTEPYLEEGGTIK